MNTNLTSCISDKIMLTTEKRAQVTISALRSFAVKRLNELWLVLSRSLLWQKCWMLFHTEVKYQKKKQLPLLLFVNCAIYLVILSTLLFESQRSGYTRVPPSCGSSNSVGKMSKFWHCTFATRLMTMRCCSKLLASWEIQWLAQICMFFRHLLWWKVNANIFTQQIILEYLF